VISPGEKSQAARYFSQAAPVLQLELRYLEQDNAGTASDFSPVKNHKAIDQDV